MFEFETLPHTKARDYAHIFAARAGVKDEDAARAILKQPDAEGMSVVGMARMCLRDAGQSQAGNPHEVFTRAMTTSDFPALLKDAANKVLAKSYGYAQGSFQKWVEPGEVPDFNINSIVRVTPPAELFEIGEDGEYKQLVVNDGEETARLKTFGGILGVSRQALINDDSGALKTPGKIAGQTAKMMQNRLACIGLLSNPVLSDGISVFHADRGNLLSGAGSALGRDSLASAVKTIRMMEDNNGSPLGIEPKILLVPPSLEVTAHELCFSDSMPGQGNSAVPNIFKNIGIVPIVEPLLESPSLTGGSSSAWYLMPDPVMWPVFRYLTLSGENGLEPYLDSQPMWLSDGIEYKVRIDFAVVPVGSKAVKSLGA